MNPAVNYCAFNYEGLSFVLDCMLFRGWNAQTLLEHVKSCFSYLSYTKRRLMFRYYV